MPCVVIGRWVEEDTGNGYSVDVFIPSPTHAIEVFAEMSECCRRAEALMAVGTECAILNNIGDAEYLIP